MTLEELKVVITGETSGLQNSVKEASSSLSGLKSTAATAGKVAMAGMAAVATATVAVVGSIVKTAASTADAAGAIDDASQRMKISSTSYQELAYAAKMSGMEMSTMEKAAKTLQASGSNLSFDEAITQVAGITDATERAAKATELFGAKAAYEMTPLLNQGAEGLAGLRSEAEQYGMVMSEKAIQAGAAFGDSLDRLKGTISGLKNSLAAEFLPSLTMAMDGLAGMVAGVEGSDAKLQEGIEGFVTSIGTVLPKVVELGSSIITGLLNGITAILPQLLQAGVDIILMLVQGIISNIPAIIGAAVQCVTALISGLAQAMPTLIDSIVSGLLTVIQTIVDEAPALLDAGLQLFMGLVEGLLKALPQIIAALPKIIDGIVNFILSAIPQIIETGITLLVALVEALPQIIQTIVAVLPQIITSIINALLANLPLIINAGIELFVALIKALPQIIAAVVKAVPQIIAAIVKAVAGGVGQMAEAGFNLVKGLFNGISNSVNWLYGKLRGWVSDVLSYVKRLFGIHSPSTVFASYGGFLTKGLANGIIDTTSVATNAVGKMANAVTDAFNPDLSISGVTIGDMSTPNIATTPFTTATSGSMEYLVSAKATGVTDTNAGMVDAMYQMSKQIVNAIEKKDLSVSLGDEEIALSAAKGNTKYTKRTGQPLFAGA